MAHRIEVGFKPSVRDAWGEKIKKRIWEDLHYQTDNVTGIDIYTLDMVLSPRRAQADCRRSAWLIPSFSTTPLTNPLHRDFDWIIEVGFRPGVTDNVGRTCP